MRKRDTHSSKQNSLLSWWCEINTFVNEIPLLDVLEYIVNQEDKAGAVSEVGDAAQTPDETLREDLKGPDGVRLTFLRLLVGKIAFVTHFTRPNQAVYQNGSLEELPAKIR